MTKFKPGDLVYIVFTDEKKQKNKRIGLVLSTPKLGQSRNPFSPSLDRINPSLGYVKNNTRLICSAMNVAINEWGERVFSQIAETYLQQKA